MIKHFFENRRTNRSIKTSVKSYESTPNKRRMEDIRKTILESIPETVPLHYRFRKAVPALVIALVLLVPTVILNYPFSTPISTQHDAVSLGENPQTLALIQKTSSPEDIDKLILVFGTLTGDVEAEEAWIPQGNGWFDSESIDQGWGTVY